MRSSSTTRAPPELPRQGRHGPFAAAPEPFRIGRSRPRVPARGRPSRAGALPWALRPACLPFLGGGSAGTGLALLTTARESPATCRARPGSDRHRHPGPRPRAPCLPSALGPIPAFSPRPMCSQRGHIERNTFSMRMSHPAVPWWCTDRPTHLGFHLIALASWGFPPMASSRLKTPLLPQWRGIKMNPPTSRACRTKRWHTRSSRTWEFRRRWASSVFELPGCATRA